jgi:hypothetical protein
MPAPVTGSLAVGPAGGTFTSPGGITVTVPAHALDRMVTVTIADNAAPGPAGSHGAVFELGPGGVVFARPVTLDVAASYGGQTPACQFTSPASGAFEDIGGKASSDGVTCKVVHTGRGYAAESSGARTFYGVSFATFNLTDGTIGNASVDLSQGTFSALISDGHGGYTTRTGAGAKEGWFAVAGVPTGDFILNRGGTYIETSEDVADLGFDIAGRPGASEPTTATTIAMNVSGLETWVAGDDIDLLVPDIDTWYYALSLTASSGKPNAGDTSLTGFTVDTLHQSVTSLLTIGNLIQNDQAFLTQLSLRSTGDTPTIDYLALSKVFTPSPFTQTNGTTTTISGAFQPAPQQSLAIALRASQFANLGPMMGPNPSSFGTTFNVVAVTNDLAFGPFSLGANCLQSAPTDLDYAGTVMFGVPSAAFHPYAQVVTQFRVDYKLGSATALSQFAALEIDDQPTAFTTGPIVPVVGPVNGPMIAGHNGFATNSGVGLTPTIAWGAPSVGIASAYQLRVNHLVEVSGLTEFQEVGRFTTAATQVSIPTGVLAAGETYFFSVTAIDAAIPPNALARAALPFASSRVLSGQFTP